MHVAKLIALVVPLGLDTFAVAFALGLSGLPPRRRLALSLWFALFEAAMPLLGAVLGRPLGRAIGDAADYAAVGLLAVVGVSMLLGRDDATRALTARPHGPLGALALGLSISLDELAIGFSAGLLGVAIVPIAIAAGVQAFVATQVGIRVGQRAGAGDWLSEIAERLAGVALLALALVLLIERAAR